MAHVKAVPTTGIGNRRAVLSMRRKFIKELHAHSSSQMLLVDLMIQARVRWERLLGTEERLIHAEELDRILLIEVFKQRNSCERLQLKTLLMLQKSVKQDNGVGKNAEKKEVS